MIVYSTSQIAGLIGIHPNTVRFYEEQGLITKPLRKPNGYRVFSELHADQFRLARLALRAEVLQNGLRQQALLIIRLTAQEDIKEAKLAAQQYCRLISEEKARAEEALLIAESFLTGTDGCDELIQTRAEAAGTLGITVETLRNWERNGLLAAPEVKAGPRVYRRKDMQRLKVIRALRCANYSLASILRMLHMLDRQEDISIREAVDTPQPHEEDAVAVCDRLITSLSMLEKDGRLLLEKIEEIAGKYYGEGKLL